MEKITFAIVCNDDRANLLAECLVKVTEQLVVYRWQNQSWRIWVKNKRGKGYWDLPNSNEISPEVDLLFLHANDSLKGNKPQGVTYKKVAKFTLPGQPPVESGECLIWPPFPYDSCPLTPEDVREFVEWVIGVRSSMPSICSRREPPSSSLQLSALSILCQGYLAVHASSDSREGTVGDALQPMGWTDDFLRQCDPSLGLSKLEDKRDLVRQANWWLNIFQNQEELKESVRQEWQNLEKGSLPEELENLLDLILNNMQVVSPKLVANAYLAIANQLA